MGVPFSQVPSDLLMDPDMTLSAIRAWHVVYVETLGRPGWDLSYGQIAEKIGTKRRQTAMEAVALLLDKGWLIRIKKKDSHGDDAPNLFSICREPFIPWNEEKGVRSSAQGGTPERTTGGTPERTTGGALERTHQKNHLPEESLPEEKITGPSGPGGDPEAETVGIVGSLDEDAEMPEGGAPPPRKKKPFEKAKKKGTHGWVLERFEAERSKAKVGTTRYNRGHLNRLLKSLRDDDGMTNEEIVVLIEIFFVRHGRHIQTKAKEIDLVRIFQQMIPQLQKQGVDTLRATRDGKKTTTARGRELNVALKERLMQGTERNT